MIIYIHFNSKQLGLYTCRNTIWYLANVVAIARSVWSSYYSSTLHHHWRIIHFFRLHPAEGVFWSFFFKVMAFSPMFHRCYNTSYHWYVPFKHEEQEGGADLRHYKRFASSSCRLEGSCITEAVWESCNIKSCKISWRKDWPCNQHVCHAAEYSAGLPETAVTSRQ